MFKIPWLFMGVSYSVDACVSERSTPSLLLFPLNLFYNDDSLGHCFTVVLAIATHMNFSCFVDHPLLTFLLPLVSVQDLRPLTNRRTPRHTSRPMMIQTRAPRVVAKAVAAKAAREAAEKAAAEKAAMTAKATMKAKVATPKAPRVPRVPRAMMTMTTKVTGHW